MHGHGWGHSLVARSSGVQDCDALLVVAEQLHAGLVLLRASVPAPMAYSEGVVLLIACTMQPVRLPGPQVVMPVPLGEVLCLQS